MNRHDSHAGEQSPARGQTKSTKKKHTPVVRGDGGASGAKAPPGTGRNGGNGRDSRPARNGKNGGNGRGAPAPADGEVLNGQPPISRLLGLVTVGDGTQLEKKTLLAALLSFRKGDFSARLPIDLEGLDGRIAEAFNDAIELNQRMSQELARLSKEVGKEGKLSQRAELGEVTGAWKGSVQSVNALISDLVHPVSETARVIGAVAKGDLSQTMALEIEGRPLAGEFLRTARTVNTMAPRKLRAWRGKWAPKESSAARRR
jgi:hypothetical protein